MIQAVDEMMLALQRAVSARVMYPPGQHVQRYQDRASQMVGQIMRDQEEIDVLVLDDRVVFDDQVLPSSANLANGLFGLLHRSGVDRITFRQGLEPAEIQSFLDQLAACQAAGSGTLQPTPHIAFSFIKESDTPDSNAQTELFDGAEAIANVTDIWQGIDDGDGFNAERASDVVINIVNAVSDSKNGLLPLAALKKHDEYTAAHVVNVAILSTALSESLGVDNTDVHEICVAALLHDIGKRNIPADLLNKKSRLNKQERLLMQTHPVEGARMLLNTPGVPKLAVVVTYEHHMSPHAGYPRTPDRSPAHPVSRLVQVVDVFDALRTNRPYRPGLPVPQILEIMQAEAGSVFEPDLLDIFFQQVALRYHAEPPAAVLA